MATNPTKQNTPVPAPTPPAYNNLTGARTDYGASIGDPDMLGGKPVPTPAPAPANTNQNSSSGGVPSPYVPRVTPPTATPTNPAEAYASGANFTPPPTEDQNYKNLLDKSSDLITDINKSYQDQLNSANAASAARVNAGGLAGSSAGGQIYTEAQQPIIDQRNQALDQVYQQINQNAQSLTQSEDQEADTQSQNAVAYNRQAKADSLALATSQITALATNHFDINDAKTPGSPNYQTYQNLVAAVGGDPNVLDAMFAMSAPAETVANQYFTSDGNGGTTVNQILQDPVTGKISHVNYNIPGFTIPQNWTVTKLGTNAQMFQAPNFNPSDPSTYVLMSTDPTNGGAITVTQNGVTTVNGVPVNDNSASAGVASAAPQVGALAGVQDISQPLSSVLTNVNVGLDGVVNGIIANEGGSPKGVVNNPGNIKYAGLPGQTDSGIKATDGGTFASYPTKQDGISAIGSLVQNASDSGETFEQFVDKYTGTGTSAPAQNLAPGTTGSPQVDSSAQGYATAPLSTAGGLTQAAVDKAAIQYAITGTMPSLGLGNSASTKAKRDAITNRAAELDSNGQISANKSKLTALTSSLGTQTTYLNTMQRSVNTVDDNLQILSGLAGKVNSSDSPIVNQLENQVKSGALGSADLAAYTSALQTVRSEYSNILARGGQVTDSVRSEAASLIPDNINVTQLQSVLDVLHQEGQNVQKEAQGQVDDISSQINNIIGGGNLYKNGNNNASSSSDSPQDTGANYGPALSQQQYSALNVPQGEIAVTDKNGNTGTIPASEYDPSEYTYILSPQIRSLLQSEGKDPSSLTADQIIKLESVSQ